MASAPSRTAEDISHSVKALMDKVIEADVAEQVSRTSRDIAVALTDAGSTAADRASEAWKESAPVRRDAAKAIRRARRDAATWWQRTWRKEIQPGARDLWKPRAVALSTAGAAVPAGRELVDEAAVRLGLKRREERHWGAFFLGLIVGAAAGAIIALLTTPKPGAEMRDELAAKAREAGEWVPMFQREETNGVPASSVTEQAETEVASFDEIPSYDPATAEAAPLSPLDDPEERA